MTDRISIPALRESADRGVYVIGRDKLLALVEAVEALENIRVESVERDRYIPMTGTIRACEAALARFDFGEVQA